MEKFEVEDIVLLDREAAESVLSTVGVLIESYGIATVSQFYETLGFSGNYTGDKWGWKTISGFKIIEVSGGYGFEYPELESTTVIFDSVDDDIKSISNKSGLSFTVLNALFAQGYMFVERMGKPYRFEKKAF